MNVLKIPKFSSFVFLFFSRSHLNIFIHFCALLWNEQIFIFKRGRESSWCFDVGCWYCPAFFCDYWKVWSQHWQRIPFKVSFIFRCDDEISSSIFCCDLCWFLRIHFSGWWRTLLLNWNAISLKPLLLQLLRKSFIILQELWVSDISANSWKPGFC